MVSQRKLEKIITDALTGKILCQRHNTALSGLDSMAIRFFEFLIGQDDSKDVLLINGNEIERWMLKVLCGLAASANIAFYSKTLREWMSPVRWLQILFSNEIISSNCGLYFISGHYRARHSKMEIVPVQKPISDDLVAIALTIDQFPFFFCMEPPPPLMRR